MRRPATPAFPADVLPALGASSVPGPDAALDSASPRDTTSGRLPRRSLLLAAASAPVLLAGCSTTSSAGGYVAGDGALTRIAPDRRAAAPRLTGTTLTGKPFDSAALAGRVVVYNVWGSWCAPCRKEAPALAQAAKDVAAQATFVGINTRDTGTAQALALVREAGIGYDSVFDPDGRLLLQFPELPPSAIPSTVVLDAQGRVAARILGETTASTLTGLVADVAAGK